MIKINNKIGEKIMVEEKILNYIKINSQNGNCLLTDSQITIALFGKDDIKTRVKVSSGIIRLKRKGLIKTSYKRIIIL
jgi:hypothetical protein